MKSLVTQLDTILGSRGNTGANEQAPAMSRARFDANDVYASLRSDHDFPEPRLID